MHAGSREPKTIRLNNDIKAFNDDISLRIGCTVYPRTHFNIMGAYTIDADVANEFVAILLRPVRMYDAYTTTG